MKRTISTAVSFGLLVAAAGFAQESQEHEALSSETDGRSVTASDLQAIESDTRELTRAERRALRRSERAAAAERETVADAQAADGEEEGLVCRREAVTGSHRRIRICTTRAEREAMRESYRETMRDVLRSGSDFGLEGVAAGLE